MPTAIADRVRLSYVAEVTYNTFPSAGLIDLRFVDEGLQKNTETVASNEIRDDRQVADIIRAGWDAGGPLNFEFTYGTYDDFLMAAIGAASWTSENIVIASDTCSVTSGTSTIALDTGSWTTTPAPYSWIYVTGFTNAGNNGYFKVASATSSNIVVINGTNLSDEAAKPGVSIIECGHVVNANTLNSYAFERKYSDLTNEFEQFTGMCVDALGLEFAANSKITGNLTLVGANAVSASSSGGTGYTEANTNPVMAVTDTLSDFWEGGTVNHDAISFSLNVAANLRPRRVMGAGAPISYGQGKCGVTGKFTKFFESSTLLDKYRNFTTTSLSLAVEDISGNGYVIDLPEVIITNARAVAGGENSDIIAECDFMTKRDATEDTTIRIARYPE